MRQRIFLRPYEMDTASFNRMIDCINTYYGFSSAEKNREMILSGMEDTWKGSCQGMVFCMYFDKIGKIDFNRNFGNAAEMSAVGSPIDSECVMGAITFYQLAQGLSSFTYPRYSVDEGNLESGIATLHDHINNNGATLCGYGTTDGGHIYIAIKSRYNASASTYSLDVIDPNSSAAPVTRIIDLSETTPTITSLSGKKIPLVSVGFYRQIDYRFLDNFDIDGVYNDMDYSKTANTSSYDIESDLFCADENAFLCVPNEPFVLTTSEGDNLFYDGVEFSGTLQILDRKYIPCGEGYPGKIQLAVSNCNRFIYRDISGKGNMFTAISSDFFGSVSGTNIGVIVIDMHNKTVSAEGRNMVYKAITETGIDVYEYFVVSGSGSNSFSITAGRDTIVASGIVGTTEMRLINDRLLTSFESVFDFTDQSVLDFSSANTTGVCRFIDENGNETPINLSVAVPGQQ